MTEPFDPTFDDCTWTDAWLDVPIAQVIPGAYASFTIGQERITEADVCGQRIAFNLPLDIRTLTTDDGILWMSDVPQERLMMFNNAQASSGKTLVGGLGLGLYPQYAMPHITELTIIEQNPDIIAAVQPIVQLAADAERKPLEVRQGSIEAVLQTEPEEKFDTLFLDTWDVLDAASLPYINYLRDLALKHVKPDGKLLLWGYVWMLKLFSTAVELMYQQPLEERHTWLEQATLDRPDVRQLLLPVLEYGDDNLHLTQNDIRLWSLNYIINKAEPAA